MGKYTSSYAYKADGKWRVGVRYKDDGKWKSKTRKATSTRKADARREAEAWRDELNVAAELEEKKLVTGTIVDYVHGYIDARKASGEVVDETITRYRNALKYIADPAGGIANVPLAELSTAHIRSWLTWLLSDETPLQRSTARSYYRMLKQFMRQAVADRVIEWNPMENMNPPKVPKKVPNSLDMRSMVALDGWLRSSEPTGMVTATALAYYGGMRRGECCGLQWADVSFENNAMLISRNAITSHAEDVRETKTGRSRVIPMALPLRGILSRRRDLMLGELTKLYGDERPWEIERMFASCFVAGGIDGNPMSPVHVSKVWPTIEDDLELIGIHEDRVTFHTLRHTFATRLIAEGVDIKTVSSILGHANASMTLDVYAASDPEAVAAAAPRIDKALGVSVLEYEDDPAYLLPSS